jgi:hypothetical protein
MKNVSRYDREKKMADTDMAEADSIAAEEKVVEMPTK